MIIDAFVLSYRRPYNLDAVVRGLRRQTIVRDIYVFHSFPSDRRVSGAIHVISDKNFGCISRHALALLTNAEYALFVDDDIELLSDLSPRFVAVARSVPFAVAGLFCRCVQELCSGDDSYLRTRRAHFNRAFTAVDIVTGRCHLCRRRDIHFLFASSVYHEYPLADDLLLNLSVQMGTGKPSIGIPVERCELAELDDREAVHDRPGHYQERSRLLNYYISLGWQPVRLAVEDRILLEAIEFRS